MPNITQDKRDVLDPYITPLLNALRELESDDPNNNMEENLQYIVTRLLKHVYVGAGSRGINDAGGAMINAYLEFYRKVAAPHNDQKEFENGIVG